MDDLLILQLTAVVIAVKDNNVSTCTYIKEHLSNIKSRRTKYHVRILISITITLFLSFKYKIVIIFACRKIILIVDIIKCDVDFCFCNFFSDKNSCSKTHFIMLTFSTEFWHHRNRKDLVTNFTSLVYLAISTNYN